MRQSPVARERERGLPIAWALEQHAVDPAQVKKVRVALSPAAFDLHGRLAHYKGKFEALISGHYTAAAVLHDRALTLDQFEPGRYDDPELRRFAEHKVEITVDLITSNGDKDLLTLMAEGQARAGHDIMGLRVWYVSAQADSSKALPNQYYRDPF